MLFIQKKKEGHRCRSQTALMGFLILPLYLLQLILDKTFYLLDAKFPHTMTGKKKIAADQQGH